MSNRIGIHLLAGLLAAGALGAAAPALAAAADEALPSFGAPMSDAEMGGLRGGAGLLGFNFGSSTFAQIGQTQTQQFSPSSPSTATSTLTAPGTTLTGTATLGATAPPVPSNPFTPPFAGSFSSTQVISLPRSFSFSFTLH